MEEVEDFFCIPSDSYLLATLRKRTAEENRRWKDRQRQTLPSMWTLCKLEMQEMLKIFECAYKPVCYLPVFLVVFLQLGHFLTEVGRKSWYMVCWKFFIFLQACFGWWTTDTVEGYYVHEKVRMASVVWDKPIRRLTKEEYAEYRKELALKSGFKRFKEHNKEIEPNLSSKIKAKRGRS